MVEKIEILDTQVKGNRLSVHVQLDTGERFWYVTTVDRTEEEITDILKQKYAKIQEAKTAKVKTKIEQLKTMKGKKIDW